ncbi:MAG: apolipoprotein A1/A4/E family protein [Candidatus Omnitrophica bacterium]|nr:apolipoprotein A1/A4/E family protein [Candidatus Omnitrophota bacterium]
MEKTDKMPLTKALLISSWIIAVSAIIIGGYVSIRGFGGVQSLISAFLISLGGLLLACVIRMFANIGQMIFDLKYFIFNNLQSLIQTLNQDLNTHLQTLNQDLNTHLQTLNQDLNTHLQSLNQDLNTHLQSLNQDLNTQLQSLNQDLNTQLQSLNQDLNTQLQTLNQDLNTQLQTLNQDLNTQLQTVSNNCEQINCDSRDISQNMHQIRTFFEQIERHLDLKK